VPTAKIDTAAPGDNTVVAADANRRIKVLSYRLAVGGAVSLTWKSGPTALTGAMPHAPGQGAPSPSAPPGAEPGVLEAAAGQPLVLHLSAAVQVSGHVSYDYLR
jgi:hypothetical protein